MATLFGIEVDAASDRVLPVTRVLAAVVVPFLVVAFGMLYLFPGSSGALFAWPIKPRMSAMMLGATYLGGAFFFTNVVFAKHWHTVRLGFLPVTAFAGILGIATLLHWDKFTPGHPSFIAWAVLYFILPFVIPVVWYLNQRVSPGGAPAEESTFAVPYRVLIGVIGGALAAAGAVLLLAPAILIPVWPWAMSALTGRVMAAMFALSGWVDISVAVDGHWGSARVIFGAQVIAVVLFLVAIAWTRAEIQWSMLTSYTLIAGMVGVLGLILAVGVQTRRARRGAARPAV
jgi:hypothetical protein